MFWVVCVPDGGLVYVLGGRPQTLDREAGCEGTADVHLRGELRGADFAGKPQTLNPEPRILNPNS